MTYVHRCVSLSGVVMPIKSNTPHAQDDRHGWLADEQPCRPTQPTAGALAVHRHLRALFVWICHRYAFRCVGTCVLPTSPALLAVLTRHPRTMQLHAVIYWCCPLEGISMNRG